MVSPPQSMVHEVKCCVQRSNPLGLVSLLGLLVRPNARVLRSNPLGLVSLLGLLVSP